MDITKKSTATLIDELVTTSRKCWDAQEKVMRGGSDKEVADAAKLAQKTNARRNELIRAIDERLGEADISSLEKTYA
jgi:hypothetical protein